MKNKISIISHTYLSQENRKTLDSISENYNLNVISPDSFKGMIFDYNENSNKISRNNWEMYFNKKINIPFLPDSVYLLKTIDFGFRKFKPDIIHIEVDTFHPLFIQVLISKFFFSRKSKIVCTVKQNTITSWGVFLDFIKKRLAIFFSNYVEKFIAVNKGVKQIYIDEFNVDEDRLFLNTQLGVDTSIFKKSVRKKSDIFIIGYCGRIVTYKGIWDLLEAVRILYKNKHKVSLKILGSGPELSDLKSYAEANPWVEIYDVVPHDEVAYFMSKLDLFVMPSRILKEHVEHDSHAVMEAMSCGIPCIASNSGSNIEVLDGIGELIEPENINLLSNKIHELMSNAEKLNEMSILNVNRVNTLYSISSVTRRLCDLYNSILNQSS